MWDYLKSVDKPIVLYGMGDGADKILNRLNSLEIEVSGVFASDGFVRHQNFRGFEVMSYKEAKEKFGNMIVLLCFGSQLPDVINKVINISKEQELYAPDVPVFGEDTFDINYAKSHKSELEKVYSILSDEKSKQVFKYVINYKLSGKIDYLINCQTYKKDDFDNILRLNNHEIFMDLGAYKGDTIEEFLQYTDNYQKIYAVEPNPKSFSKLLKNTESLENCICINTGIYSKKDVLPFNNKSGRNSAVSNTGNFLPVDSIDNILNGQPVTYIKMDLEGQESNAIDGANNTILKYKPKLLISAYHRNEDLFSIPLKILSIRDDYKVYLRHNPYIPAWDTNFYFI